MAFDKPLALNRASSLASLGSQQALGPKQCFKFSMFWLSRKHGPESRVVLSFAARYYYGDVDGDGDGDDGDDAVDDFSQLFHFEA